MQTKEKLSSTSCHTNYRLKWKLCTLIIKIINKFISKKVKTRHLFKWQEQRKIGTEKFLNKVINGFWESLITQPVMELHFIPSNCSNRSLHVPYPWIWSSGPKQELNCHFMKKIIPYMHLSYLNSYPDWHQGSLKNRKTLLVWKALLLLEI